MSTRCYVGKLNKDGTVRAIYVHHDGYIKYVGAILKKHYNTEAKINELLDLGDMSTLGTKPVATWTDTFQYDEDKCYTYRERGELNVDARTFNSVDEYLDRCQEDYTYLYKNGRWYVREWDDEELLPYAIVD